MPSNEVKLLRAMATGTDWIASGHAAIFTAAADRIEALEAECFMLAAGVCEYRVGNEHGNAMCAATGKLIESMKRHG